MADRGKSAARVDWQQAFLLTLVFVFALARPNSAHAFQPLDPNSWPFIPVPEVATSPNGGTTYGLMTVFLQHDDHGNVSSIIAPDITNNTTLGVGGGGERDPDTEVESRRAVRFPLSACNTRRDRSPLSGRD